MQHSRIDSAGIEKYFDGLFISEEIGGRKPEPEYFQRCFERIPDFCKTHTAILGDSLSADMQGGKNAGITTIWFNRDDMPDEEGVRPDYEIRSLYELPPLLKRICGTKPHILLYLCAFEAAAYSASMGSRNSLRLASNSEA